MSDKRRQWPGRGSRSCPECAGGVQRRDLCCRVATSIFQRANICTAQQYYFYYNTSMYLEDESNTVPAPWLNVFEAEHFENISLLGCGAVHIARDDALPVRACAAANTQTVLRESECDAVSAAATRVDKFLRAFNVDEAVRCHAKAELRCVRDPVPHDRFQ